jgi:hypothetical protein
MSNIKFQILHGFGSNCHQGLYDSVSIINSSDEIMRLLYPIGKYFALKTIDSYETSFIQIPDQTSEIECMAVSPDRTVLALSHVNTVIKMPILTLFYLSK